MTDPTDSSESPEVAEVRRLLAAARHDEPMPSDVASRMDDVLAGLRDEPVRRDDVVPISAARRRKVGALLVAAAVVVVGGAVVAPHLPRGGSAAPTSAADSEGSTKSSELGNSGNAPPAGPASPDASQSLTQMDRLELRDGRVVVHPRRFSVDALRSRSLLPQADAAARLGDCAAVPQHDDVLAARYRRAPAALVFRQARGGSQVVDLYICGSPRPIRSATLPAP